MKCGPLWTSSRHVNGSGMTGSLVTRWLKLQYKIDKTVTFQLIVSRYLEHILLR